MEQPDAATDASDGLADREAAERFHQAVEHRLSEPTPAEPGSEEPAPGGEPEEDNLVSVDKPE